MTNSTVCLPGGDFHLFTYCKPGGNNNTYTFRSVTGVVASPNVTTRVDCSGQITTSGIISGAVWNSISPGNPGDYNSYLSSTTITNPIFTAGAGAPSTIVYRLCGNVGSTACNALGTDCTDITINVRPAIAVNLNINTTLVCVNNPLVLVADINPVGPNYTYEWHTGTGATSLPVLKTGTTLNLGAPVALGWYSLKVTDVDAVGVACSSQVIDFQLQADLTGPSIFTPPAGILTINCNDPNASTLIQNWLTSASALDESGNNIPISNNYTGITMACGTDLPVTFSSLDHCGNISTAIAHIKIVDTVAPVWVSVAGALDQTLSCSDAVGLAAAQLLKPVASDNCDLSLAPVKTSGLLVPGACAGTGTYTNTWTVKDACLNSAVSTFTQVITLTDNVAPVVTLPVDITISCGVGLNPLPALTGTATATDNCSPTASISITYTDALPVVGSCPGESKIVRTWKATDACGNSATATQNILEQDITAPVITTPAQTTSVVCDGSGNIAQRTAWLLIHASAVATDACGTVTWTNDSPVISNSCGSTTYTFTATDGCGNTSTTQGTFTITDNQPPVITCPAGVNGVTDNGQCVASAIVLGTATATDNCTATGNITITNNAPSQFTVGVTTVVWTASDGCGNTATCNQLVTIVDNNQPPVFTSCPTDQIQNIVAGGCSLSNVIVPDPTYTDNCPGSALTWVMSGATTGSSSATGVNYVSGQTFNVGITTVVYTLTDATNIAITCSFKVWIKNLINPLFQATCPTGINQNITAVTDPLLCTAAVTVPAPAISNPCNEAFTMVNNSPYKTSLIDASGIYPIGLTSFTWTITDASGNVTICNQSVTVTDNQPPTITCPGNIADLITNGGCTKVSALILPPTITDNCTSPALSYSILLPDLTTATGNGLVSAFPFPAGVSTVTYTVTDAGGLTASCSFTVTIKNLLAPPLTVNCAAAANMTQAIDPGFCTADVTVPSPVINNPCLEVYTQTWVMSGATTGSSPLTGVNNVSTYTFNFGLTTITWTITDASGNIKQCTQTVTVTGATPTLNCPANIAVYADFMLQYKDIVPLLPPTYTVACGLPTVTWSMTYPVGDPRPNPASALTGINLVTSPARFYVGVTTITYTVADANGNSNSCSFTVTILAKPDITCLVPVSYVTDAGKCWHTVQSADADNPGVPTLNAGSQPIDWTWTITNPDMTIATGTITTTAINPVPTKIGPYDFQRGVSTILWHAQNPSGFYECTQTVTVNDILPTFTLPAAISECVESIRQAAYDPANLVTDNYSPNRPDYFIFVKGSKGLDLVNLVFNCCATIHWTINFSGGASLTGTGQPSTYISDIIFPGDVTMMSNLVHTISYQVADCGGFLTPVQTVNITIKPRPDLIKMP
jgi:hypothetical protein